MRENDIHVYKQSGADQQYRFQTANLCSTAFIRDDFFVCGGARPQRCCFRFYFMGKGGAPQRADAVIALGKNINNAGAFAGGAPDNFRFFTEGGTKESFGKCGRGDKSVLLYAINVENCIHFEYMFFIKTVQE